jgi:transcriptional regulator with XRE-family HTH domain
MDSLHPLKQWIEKNTTPAQFARDVGISESYLSEILNLRKSPSLGLAARLSRATSGDVPIGAFVKEAAE